MNKYDLAEYLASKGVEPPYEGGCAACEEKELCDEDGSMARCWRNWFLNDFEKG